MRSCKTVIQNPKRTMKTSSLFGIFTHSNRRLLAIFLLLTSLTFACNSSILSKPTSTEAYPPPTQPATPMPEAMISFNVQLPPNTPLNQPIQLNVLDEVTGLALNVNRFDMQAEDDFHYTVSLPFPVGSIIKYRYSRLGNYTALEHTSNKNPVRYRLYAVEGPGTVQDVISAWSDTAFSGPTGRIKGQAFDLETGKPIPDLLIAAAGNQTLTASDGSFTLEGLPVGTHNLVGYALDGSYRSFQQGAVVAEGSTTEADIKLKSAPLVTVVFTVVVPQDTMPAVPIRMAGNLIQIGNTFADLSGGMNLLTSRMPVLSPLPDGRYNLSMKLHAGSYINYKYTLGDGFWNAEHKKNGEFKIRHLIVPETNTIIEDSIETWGGGTHGPILFDLEVPDDTPTNDNVSIQFNPYGWTEPIPMWFLEQNHWVYVLYSPLNIFDKFGYRYCRNDQCGSVDDVQTVGNDSFGRTIENVEGPQTKKDSVDSWYWLDEVTDSQAIPTPEVNPRGENFIAGIEFQNSYHPSWTPRMPVTLQEIETTGSNWVIFSPSWTYTRQSPPILEQVPGIDPFWSDLTDTSNRAQAFGLNVALFPSPHFQLDADEWWAGASRDFSWWLVWFEYYRTFAIHHADLAQQSGAKALVLGGEWIDPALPGGHLSDGSASGVPADADERWRDLLNEVRQHFNGTIIWALPFKGKINNPPPFLDAVDQIYLLWSAPLSSQTDASEADMQHEADRLMDEQVKPLYDATGIPIIIGASYPSAEGATTGCLPDPTATVEARCLNTNMLSRPMADIPTISLDLGEQTNAYVALLSAINERDWVSGFTSRGYYPPAALEDKSTSVHGKPAEQVLSYWFKGLLAPVSP